MLRSIQVQFEPIDKWPEKPTVSRKASKFKTRWSDTCKLLERELLHLGCRRLVIQLDCDRSQIRQDGLPRADARARPGVILAFQSKHGPLRYPCDTFYDWQDNVRAIALALEALRTVDRYGVTKRAEQYKGWAALPSPNGDHWSTKEQAREFLKTILGKDLFAIFANNDEQLLLRSEMKTHPDKGGNPDDFKKVQQARKLLLA